MSDLDALRQPIDDELKAYRALFVQTLQQDNPLLQIAVNHLLKKPGKMMRPILVLLAAKYAGGVNEPVLHAAVSLELLHTATLVHDDVVDHSERRRGQRSMNALLDNRAAVLVGDFLLSKALYHAAATGSNRVVKWVALLGQMLSDGELLQLVNIDKTEISENDYFEVIRRKTASLFETSAKAGTLLAGGGEEDVRQMGDFGSQTGMCFQMRDDIFDYDYQHDTGKPSGNDMREGKLTLPVIQALLSTGDTTMRELALKVRSGLASDQDIATLVAFTKANKGIEYTEKIMDKYAHKAVDTLSYKKDSDPKIFESLSDYVRYVVGRDF